MNIFKRDIFILVYIFYKKFKNAYISFISNKNISNI